MHYLIADASTVELDLHDVSLLLPAAQDLHLGVADDADHGAVLLNLVEVLNTDSVVTKYVNSINLNKS